TPGGFAAGERKRATSEAKGPAHGRAGPRLLRLERSCIPLFDEASQYVINRDRAEVLATPDTDGNRICLLFAITHDQHVRHLHELVMPNLSVHALAAVVDFDADSACVQSVAYLSREGDVPVGDGDEH